MFDLFQLPERVAVLSRRIFQMSQQLDELRNEVAALKGAVAEEKSQVDQRFAALEAQIEDLLTQPPAELDLTFVLEEVRSIRADVANIYEPAPEPAPEPEPEPVPEPEAPIAEGVEESAEPA